MWLDRCNTSSTAKWKKYSHKSKLPEMPSMETIEQDLVAMLGETGKIKLDALKPEYSKYYGKPLVTKGRLAKVLRELKGIKMTKIGNGNFQLSANPSMIQNDGFQHKPNKSDDETIQRLLDHCGGSFRALRVHQDPEPIFDILPEWISRALRMIDMQRVSDIALDCGRVPYCWYEGERKFLHGDTGEETVKKSDLECIVEKLGKIGDDNRTGIDKQLHRISCIRDNDRNIIGLTLRVGRHVEGNADIIRDLLEDSRGSILFLGEPGTGKTTIVREVAKILAEKQNVFVIDTSNEIAGNGQIPHPCIGMSRKLMVPSLEKQANIMIECVQNHTPSVMVIDEIGRMVEVKAASTSKNRGVRMIASAHGDLRSLMKNKDLVGLLGGLQSVTLGDDAAKEEAARKGQKHNIQKQKTERGGAPVFDIIIELRKEKPHEWNTILNTARACDDILDGRKYKVLRRLRDANSGAFFVEWDKL